MIEKKPTPLLQKIFELRKAKKLTLADLGRAIGVERPTASHIENGEIPLKAEYLPTVAKFLGVETWELFVDYDAKHVGPLSEEEVKLISSLRKIKDLKLQKSIQDLLERFLDKNK